MIEGIINARNPGIFFYPSPGALLSLICFLFYIRIVNKISLGKYILVVLSVAFTASLSGVLSLIALTFTNKKYFSSTKIYILAILLSLSTLPYAHIARHSMTGDTYLEETAGGRIKLFKEAFFRPENKVISKFGVDIPVPDMSLGNFGRFSNIYYSFNKENAGLADSTYTAIVGNLGLNHAIIFLLLSVYLIMRNSDFSYRIKHDLLLAGLFCYGINLSEVPIAVLLFILFSIQFGTSPQVKS
jgi:hypothetical protein